MRLTAILGAIGASCSSPDIRRAEVSGLSIDSRSTRAGELFFAISGAASDGHGYVARAGEQGAVAAVVSREISNCPVPQIVVEDTREALALAACEFYDHPSASFPLIGITGTNGKTTVAWMVQQMLAERGIGCGLLGTIYNITGPDECRKSDLTTDMPHHVQQMLATMRDNGLKAAVIEVSSHALDQKRTLGTSFQVAVFMNLTPDHLDYHQDMESYFAAKSLLFSGLESSARSVVGWDDPWGEKLLKAISGPVITFGHRQGSDIRILEWCPGEDGARIKLEVFGKQLSAEVGLLGGFNAQNIAAACGVGVAMGINADSLQRILPMLKSVPGRMEPVRAGQPYNVLVDYAHTPDALEKALDAAREHTRGRLVSIVGCGGDRMTQKRAPMGEIAIRKADFTVVTSDNPRSEDPLEIIEMVLDGVSRGGGVEGENYLVEPDRGKAIKAALVMMAAGDTLLIAGKGHEDYQILPGGTIHFDDREVAREVILS
jgi:UDP-N-acetylmuramoyl-L-alanyl-D-glutamate--2,6-diaminopimelate ligase